MICNTCNWKEAEYKSTTCFGCKQRALANKRLSDIADRIQAIEDADDPSAALSEAVIYLLRQQIKKELQ